MVAQAYARVGEDNVKAYVESALVAGTQLAWSNCPFLRNPQDGSITLCDDDLQAYLKLVAPAMAARGPQGADWPRHESTHTQLAMILARVLRSHPQVNPPHQTLTAAIDFVGISSFLADSLLAEQPIETIDARALLGEHHDAIMSELEEARAAAAARDKQAGIEWERLYKDFGGKLPPTSTSGPSITGFFRTLAALVPPTIVIDRPSSIV